MSNNVLPDFSLPPSSPGSSVKLRTAPRQSHAARLHPRKAETDLSMALARLVWGCFEPRSRFLVEMRAKVNQTKEGQKSRPQSQRQEAGQRSPRKFALLLQTWATGGEEKQSKQASSLQLSEVKLKDWMLVIWFMSAYELLPTRLNWRQCDCLWKQGVNTIQIWSEIVFKANFNPWYFQKCQLTLFESADILPTKPRSKPSYN